VGHRRDERSRRRSRAAGHSAPSAATLLIPYVWIGYVVWVGGDAFPFGRFFVVIIPLLALLTGKFSDDLVTALWRSRVRLAKFAAPAVALMIVGTILASHMRTAVLLLGIGERPFASTISAACIAHGIRAIGLPSGALIGVFWAGMTP